MKTTWFLAALLLGACSSVPTDQEVCAKMGVWPTAGELYWRCMEYAQTDRLMSDQNKAAKIAAWGAIRPRSCTQFGSTTQCW